MRAYDILLGVKCVCNVGVQYCEMHPDRLREQAEKITFRKAWDDRVETGMETK